MIQQPKQPKQVRLVFVVEVMGDEADQLVIARHIKEQIINVTKVSIMPSTELDAKLFPQTPLSPSMKKGVGIGVPKHEFRTGKMED